MKEKNRIPGSGTMHEGRMKIKVINDARLMTRNKKPRFLRRLSIISPIGWNVRVGGMVPKSEEEVKL